MTFAERQHIRDTLRVTFSRLGKIALNQRTRITQAKKDKVDFICVAKANVGYFSNTGYKDNKILFLCCAGSNSKQ
jgi:hypothetical protein